MLARHWSGEDESDKEGCMLKTTCMREISEAMQKYSRDVPLTDKLPTDDLRPVLFGLFGEVGSVMASAKKAYREKLAYSGYRSSFLEEMGDVLWYCVALCSRIEIDVVKIFSDALGGSGAECLRAEDDSREGGVEIGENNPAGPMLADALLKMGSAAAELFRIDENRGRRSHHVSSFAQSYLRVLRCVDIRLDEIIRQNWEKARGRFLEPEFETLPIFDSEYAEDERLPDQFEIRIVRRSTGAGQLQWNGVFIGNALTDNILDADGYRYHDVFHLAHAAVLHWSPTFRALIKRKRKTRPDIDETQDGGRAIVVEEGLTAWVFARAKQVRFFAGQEGLSFDLLKGIQQFVRGYEVEACPLKLWESAILQGYEVFREVRANGGGTVVGNRGSRKIWLGPL